MDVYQIRIKLFLLQNIPADRVQEKVTIFIDTGFARRAELLRSHKENQFKRYCYDSFYPVEKDKVYKEGHIYTITVRTIDWELADFFNETYGDHATREMKGLVTEMRILPKKMIEYLYTLTPAILKDHQYGYWRTHMSLEKFEERLKNNLIKKWNYFTCDRIREDFPLYTCLEFLNTRPISVKYKQIHLLGDKIRLQIADDELSQKLAYLALGTGLLELNARGYGFVNYRWL